MREYGSTISEKPKKTPGENYVNTLRASQSVVDLANGLNLKNELFYHLGLVEMKKI